MRSVGSIVWLAVVLIYSQTARFGVRRLDAALFIVALICAQTARCGEVTPVRETDPPFEVRGPRVEITPCAGKPYSCVLLSMKEGVLECRLLNGESKRQKTGDVQSLRFLPPPAPKLDKTEEMFSEKDIAHYNRLFQRDREGELTNTEVDEFFKLRERLPLSVQCGKFKGDAPHEVAQHEAAKGRLDRYISLVQSKLKRAQTMDTVRIAVIMLKVAYDQKELSILDSRLRLRHDVETIEDAQLREKIPNKLSEIIERHKIDKNRRK
ncbi:MAG: hypothetical protein V1899_05520 [Planctomycetota bacterium]